jgi:hypothetical protein
MSRLPRLDVDRFVRVLEFARIDGKHLTEVALTANYISLLNDKTGNQITVSFDGLDVSPESAMRVLKHIGISHEYLREILLDVKE